MQRDLGKRFWLARGGAACVAALLAAVCAYAVAGRSEAAPAPAAALGALVGVLAAAALGARSERAAKALADRGVALDAAISELASSVASDEERVGQAEALHPAIAALRARLRQGESDAGALAEARAELSQRAEAAARASAQDIAPMERLNHEVRAMVARIESGDYVGPPADVVCGQPYCDEIVEALRFFAAVIEERGALKDMFISQHAETERLLQEAESRLRHADQVHEEVVRETCRTLRSFAAGDFSHRMLMLFPEAFQDLQTECNLLGERLEDYAGGLGEASLALARHTGETASALNRLSEGGARARASAAAASGALEEIAQGFARSGASAARVREAVASTREEARAGDAVLRETIAAIDQVEETAKEISRTINVIDEIAFQTNLLALNAGVEAARAGDSGRGFSVIAEEVRALSQRATESAKAIKSLIQRSEQQVHEGARMVDKSGEALSGIVKRVDDINALVEAMAALAENQGASLSAVRGALTEIETECRANGDAAARSQASSQQAKAHLARLAERAAAFSEEGLGAQEDVRRSA